MKYSRRHFLKAAGSGAVALTLAGHICRCAAYSAIIRTVVDTGKVLRGEAEIV